MNVELIQNIYYLIGSTLGIISFFNILYEIRKEKIIWFTGAIDSNFHRIDKNNITVKLKFQLTNRSRRPISITNSFLKIIEYFSISLIPENKKPINLQNGESKIVELFFKTKIDIPNAKDFKREELINYGLNAELELYDSEGNRGVAPLFIYEDGFENFFNLLGRPTPKELGIIIERGVKSKIYVGI